MAGTATMKVKALQTKAGRQNIKMERTWTLGAITEPLYYSTLELPHLDISLSELINLFTL